MFFLLGWRYPVVSLIIGVALVIAGVAVSKIAFVVLGLVAVVFGGYRCVAALRRRSLTSGGNPGRLR
jgi:uncharacterized membrane protein HdeD (DUF308 family)